MIKADYDKNADVLYFIFEDAKADYGKRNGNFIIRYKGQNVVGITILDASKVFDITKTQLLHVSTAQTHTQRVTK